MFVGFVFVGVWGVFRAFLICELALFRFDLLRLLCVPIANEFDLAGLFDLFNGLV